MCYRYWKHRTDSRPASNRVTSFRNWIFKTIYALCANETYAHQFYMTRGDFSQFSCADCKMNRPQPLSILDSFNVTIWCAILLNLGGLDSNILHTNEYKIDTALVNFIRWVSSCQWLHKIMIFWMSQLSVACFCFCFNAKCVYQCENISFVLEHALYWIIWRFRWNVSKFRWKC